jgi:predicted adenylyl cyclase CyaB
MTTARNIELKARLANLASVRQIAERLATAYLGTQHQIDTFFHCANGRLKLREIQSPGKLPQAQLIPYARADQAKAKASDYRLVEVSNVAALKQALITALGVKVVVEKHREIFLYNNVRIHLDEVAGLGAFIEFEAVLGLSADETAAHVQLELLEREFRIQSTDFVPCAYADLLLGRRTAE